MDANASIELNLIKRDLKSIIDELEEISCGVRRDFQGIGNETCADCIYRAAEQYRWVKGKLDNLDTTTVTESFAEAHSTEC